MAGTTSFGGRAVMFPSASNNINTNNNSMTLPLFLALPEQYSNLGRSVNDVSEELCTAFRKFVSKKTGNKPKKTCQTLANAFFQKKK